VQRSLVASLCLAAPLALACGSRTALLDGVAVAGAVTDGAVSDVRSGSADGALPPAPDASSFEPFAVGALGTCFLHANGTVGCFFYPTEPLNGAPLTVTLQTIPGVDNATEIAGTDPYCARLADGTVPCWSLYNPSNPNGDGGVYPAVPIPGLDHVTRIAVSGATSQPGIPDACAVRDDGTVWCMGDNTYNELGLGDLCPPTNQDCDTSIHRPAPVIDVSDATDVAVSAIDACAMTRSGAVECWGRVGIGDTADYPNDRGTPIHVPAAQGALSLAMSEGITVATLPGALVVFGHPFDGEAPDAPTPLFEARATGEQVYGNQYDTLCTKEPGLALHCKGGMSLDGTATNPGTFDVPGTADAIDVGLSTFTGCVRLSASELVCWGAYFGAVTQVTVL